MMATHHSATTPERVPWREGEVRLMPDAYLQAVLAEVRRAGVRSGDRIDADLLQRVARVAAGLLEPCLSVLVEPGHRAGDLRLAVLVAGGEMAAVGCLHVGASLDVLS